MNAIEKLATGEDLTDEDKIVLGQELMPVFSTVAWDIVKLTIGRLRQEALENNITDKDHPREFYAGQVEAYARLVEHLAAMVEEGVALQEKADAKPRTVRNPRVLGALRPGGGGFREG